MLEYIQEALPKGALWIDHTSTDPDEPARLALKTVALGLRYVEAPLTGGVSCVPHLQSPRQSTQLDYHNV